MSQNRLVRYSVTCSLLVALSSPVYAQSPIRPPQSGLYRSNAVAMLLERVGSLEANDEPAVRDIEYYVSISTIDHDPGQGETRRVRMEHYGPDGLVAATEIGYRGQTRAHQIDYSEGRRTERFFDREGRKTASVEYDSGEVFERAEYSYRSGRLVGRTVYEADGNLLYQERYRYDENGRLASTQREYHDGFVAESDYLFRDDRLVEEWHQTRSETLYVRYDRAGRLLLSENLLDGSVAERERFFYPDGDTDRRTPPVGRVFEDFDAGVREVTDMDRNGRPVRLERFVGGTSQLVRTFEYVDGNLAEEVVTTADGEVRTIRYEYDEDDERTVTEQFRDGVRVSRITHLGDEREIEERYISGELALRIEREGERRVTEQVIEDGEVVRERHFE